MPTDNDHAAWGASHFLKAVTDFAPVVIYVFNHETMSNEYSNRSIGALLGYSAIEVQSMGETLMQQLVHPSDLSAVLENFDVIRNLADGETATIEYRMKHSAGHWVWLLSTDAVFSRNADGAVTRHLGTAVDITDQKLATEEARRAEEAAHATNEELRAFAYSVSHDLKSPSNTLELIFSEMRNENLDDTTANLLGMADATVTRMKSIIDDVLAYTRVIGEPQDFADVDLNVVLEGVVGNLRADIDATGVELRCGPLPVVRANATQLHICFQNLLANAIKFRREGVTPSVQVLCHQFEDEAKIIVSDKGIGIAEDKYDEVFTIFKRLHANTDYDGTGLGLAICQRIAMNHNTRIKLRSTPGEGSEFSISLPLAVRRDIP